MTVCYVDTGFVADVPYEVLFKLPEKALTIPSLGLVMCPQDQIAPEMTNMITQMIKEV